MGRNLGPLNIKDSYEGLVQISGSQLTDGSGSLITDLTVTASDATLATTASYAVSASHAVFADTAGSAPDANALYTASISDATINFLKGGGGTFNIEVNNVSSSISSSYAVSSSYALTASYAENAVTPNLQDVTTEGNVTTTAISSSTVLVDGVRTYGVDSISSVFAGRTFKIQAGGGTDLSELILTGDTLQNAAIKIKGTTGVAVSGSTFFQDEITINSDAAKTITTKGGIEISSSTAPTLEIQSLDATIDPSILFQSGSTYTGYVAGTTNHLELGDFNSSKVKISGSSLEVDLALTASGLNYPTSDGTAGQVLTTDGLGNLTLEDAGGGDAFPFSGSAEITGSLIVSGSTTADSVVLQTKDIDGNDTEQRVQLAAYGTSTIGASVVNGALIAVGTGTINNSGQYNSFGAGADTITLGGNNTAIVGGYNITNEASSAFVGGGENHYIQRSKGAIVGGFNNKVWLSGERQAIVGGADNQASSLDSFIGGGENNNIGRDNNDKGVILGGVANIITGSATNINATYNTIINSQDSDIQGSTLSGIYQSSGSLILDKTGSVIIGGAAVTADADNTVYMPNLTLTGSGATLTFDDGTTMTTAAAPGASTLQEVLNAGDVASGSNVILEKLTTSTVSPVTQSGNESTFIFGAQVSESLQGNLEITGNTGSFIGGISADLANYQTSSITNNQDSLIFGSKQISTFTGNNLVNAVTASAVLASTNSKMGTYSGGGGDGPSNHGVIIASNGAGMSGQNRYCAIIASEGVTMNGSGNPRFVNSIIGTKTATINKGIYDHIAFSRDSTIPTSFKQDLRIVASNNSSITNGSKSNVLGGQLHTISTSNADTVGGYDNNITGGTYPGIYGGRNNNITGGGSLATILGSRSSTISAGDTIGISLGQQNQITSGYNDYIFGGRENKFENRSTNSFASVIVGAYNSRIHGSTTGRSAILGGTNNDLGVTADVQESAVIVGNNHDMQHNRSVILGGTTLTSTKDDEVLVPKLTIADPTATDVLVIANYAGLSFADDTAAAAGGVPLGGVYHVSGKLQIRIV